MQDHLECTHRPTYINPTQTYATHIHLESKQPNWRLHSQLILECSQRRCGVVGPVSPGTAGQAILLKKQSLLCCLMLSAKPAGLRMIFNASIFYGISTQIVWKQEMISWKNIPMIAIIASRPFASSAESFLVFSAGSDEVKTLKPKSPAAAGVPGD